MPEIKHYIVRQERSVRVMANNETNALIIALSAFNNGQDANGHIFKTETTDGIYGDTTSRVSVVDTHIEADR